MSSLPSLTELWTALFGDSSLPEVPGAVKTRRELEGLHPLKASREVDASVMAKTAKSEDPDAAAAVMYTLLNRSKKSGSTIPDAEALKPEQYHGWRGGDPSKKWKNLLERRDYQRILEMAKGILDGTVENPIGDRTHFHAIESPAPPWAPPPEEWLKVGKTAFYNPVRRSSR